MAALDLDLEHSAKHALLVVACRADHRSPRVQLSVSRVAADMAVNYTTAHRALDRLVENGYLTVDKSPGHPSTWRLEVVTGSRGGVAPDSLTSSGLDDQKVVTGSRGGREQVATKDLLDKRERYGDDAAPLAEGRAAPPREAVDSGGRNGADADPVRVGDFARLKSLIRPTPEV
jgi:predicted ArsR family transcriptional regulator